LVVHKKKQFVFLRVYTMKPKKKNYFLNLILQQEKLLKFFLKVLTRKFVTVYMFQVKVINYNNILLVILVRGGRVKDLPVYTIMLYVLNMILILRIY
jgi:hypothetical protein